MFISAAIVDVSYVAWYTHVAGREGVLPLLAAKDHTIDMGGHGQDLGSGMNPIYDGMILHPSQATGGLCWIIICAPWWISSLLLCTVHGKTGRSASIELGPRQGAWYNPPRSCGIIQLTMYGL